MREPYGHKTRQQPGISARTGAYAHGLLTLFDVYLPPLTEFDDDDIALMVKEQIS